MQNSTSTTTVNLNNLSESEIELIRIQREKDQLAAQEKAAQLKQRIEKAIKDEQTAMQSFIQDWQRQNAAAREYAAQLRVLDSNFSIKETAATKQFGVFTDKDDSYPSTLQHRFQYELKQNETMHWTETVDYVQLEIVHSSVNKTIEVKEHFTNTGRSRYHSRSVSQGYKMCIKYGDNRFTKDAKNMFEKFDTIIRQQNRENKEKQDAATSKDMAHKLLTQKYPDATIEHKTEWVRNSHSRSQGPSGYDTHFFVVKFNNGYSVKFTYGFHNNELYIHYNGMIKPEKFSSNILDAESANVNALIAALQNIA